MNPLLKGSEARLWQLIEERTHPGADSARIEQRIWDLFGETWCVMFTDLAGFSRQVASFGIIHFLQVIYEQNQLLHPIIGSYDGILIKIEADSLLVIFRRPQRALECAIAMQRACTVHNQGRLPEEQILLCLGIGYGPVLRIGDSDVFGREVNAASRLGEDTAKAGEILLTGAAATECTGYPDVTFEDLDLAVPGSARNLRARY